MSLKDAAATFDISVSKLKKHCREYGIRRWPSQFAQNQLWEKIEKELGQRSFDQHSNSLVSPAINQPSSSGSNADNQVYAEDHQTSEINVEDSSIGHFDSYAEEPHSFRPTEREESQERLYSYFPDFQIQPLTYSLLPSISQLNLSPIKPNQMLSH
ncbi:hypothetical protein PNK_1698 [Candidatus Protochlamydia naegleriophila]|uniref:RWP-RK domain-containing protein n=1 Tax=Candidatus Protochlamydia naegleriophila TaxID=389348 RepID=A0A0U5K5B8_9BACT|nr:hypothetical protein PNK_1698 [Candidatus Protochlamydia naegleriophila]